jgi:drug/metabolite transporter (DMT)-like permease
VTDDQLNEHNVSQVNDPPPVAPVVPTEVPSDRLAFAPVDWGLFVFVGMVWGSSFLLIKVGLDAFHPGLITWARVVLGAATLVVVPRARGRIDRDDWSRLILLSVVWVAVPFTLFPLAEERINSAVTGLLNAATPLFTGIFAALLFDRRPRGPQAWGIGVGFVGVAMISVGSGAEGGGSVVGVVMVLVATVFYGLATNLAAPLQQRYGSVPVMSKMLVLASIWTAPFGLVGLADSTFEWDAAVATAVLGAVGTGVAFAAMATLVGRVGGPRASFITYLIPLVSLALGAAVLDEKVVPLALAGAALVLAGAVLASRAES